MNDSGLVLAAGAVEGAAVLLWTMRRIAPAAAVAGLALAAVGGERHLEVAGIALAVGEVVQGRAALLDRLAEHRPHRPRELLPTGRRDPRHRALGVDAAAATGPRRRRCCRLPPPPGRPSGSP